MDTKEENIIKTEELTNEEKIELYKKQQIEIIKERAIQVVIGQTEYSREEAIEKLIQTRYDPIKVIKQYMGINSEETKQKKEEELNLKSKNQKIYKVIRDCMDDAAKNYYIKQEKAKLYEEIIEKQKQQLEENKKYQE